MRNFPSHLIENFPDPHSELQFASNQRQREEYCKFIYRAIKTQLTARQRQMIELYYIDNLRMYQIAEELHVNKGTVSRAIKVARKRLEGLAEVYFDIKL